VRFTFDVGRTVGATPEAAWAVLSDTTRWAEWSPAIAAVECDDRFVEAGTEGRVQTPLGVWLGFEVIDLEPGGTWRWKVSGIPATGHRVDHVGDDPATCHVVIEVPILAAPYAGVATLALRNIEQLAVAWAG
jgi:hypothetical protein